MGILQVNFNSSFFLIWRSCLLNARSDTGNDRNHVFHSIEELYKKIHFKVFDQVTSSSTNRFDTDSAQFCQFLETFAMGQSQPTDKEKIIKFYQGDFDKEILLDDRTMFLSLVE